MNPLIRGLMRPEAYDHPVTEIQLLETHISWVILTGDYAYKLKKPVDLGFVDFTTLDRRHHFCEEEIRLNRRLAAELYLGVRPIYGSPEQPTFIGQGEPIEFAVQMRQFDQASLLPAVLERGDLRPDQADRLAVTIAEFHRTTAVADPSSPFGRPEAVRAPAVSNFDDLQTMPIDSDQIARRPVFQTDTLPSLQTMENDSDQIALLRTWTDAEFLRRRDWFQQRHHDGWIRECHGDMHLGNMVLLDDVIRVFDCLEFNPSLRWIDVMGEIAFLVMDLQERGRPDMGFRVLNGWLEQIGDYAGLRGWHWYLVYRAMVRAKVAALRLQQAELEAEEREQKRREFTTYLALARRWTEARPTAVIIMHGVSGSGKSHVAQSICEQFGAIRLRSDVERKRLFDVRGTTGTMRLAGDMYTPEVTQILYRDVLAGQIPGVLDAGFSVVIDATCLRYWQRQLFRDVARRLNVPFLVIDVRADPETLRRRIQSRLATAADPSDATVAIMEQQLKSREELTDEELQTSLIVDTQSSDWSSVLDAALQYHIPKIAG